MDFIFDSRGSDSPLVDLIWHTHSSAEGGSFMSQAVSQWEMVITRYLGQTTLTMRGPETRAQVADTPPDAEFFGIQFKLGTYMPHLPISMLVDHAITLPDATGKAFWFQGAVWQLPTFENADTFINRMMRDGLIARDPVITSALQGHPVDLSPRALQYRFLNATGLTQTTVRQIQRARDAAALLERGMPILDTVYEMGYFDQAHLTRSLKRFLGQTPAQLRFFTRRAAD